MRAAWYDRTGAAEDVLVVGELTDPEPDPGEVRVRIAFSSVNPADTKRRAGAGGRTMIGPRVIPGDDGAGIIDRVGDGVDRRLVGRRVWVHSANHERPFGTSAELVTVPAERAVPLPDGAPLEIGACIGVPLLTAHRCLFADGPVTDRTVLVTGGAGAVGHYAIELAKEAGAHVIATASTAEKRAAALAAGADLVVDYRAADAVEQILDAAGPNGVSRVVDVAFGANLPLTTAVIARDGVIASYGSDAVPEPTLPFYSLMRRGVTIRTVLVFVMPPSALRTAIEDATRLLERNALTHPIARRYPLAEIVRAHQAVERGEAIGKVLVRLPSA